MNEETLYKKVGRKYVPIAEHQRYDYIEKGHWLVNIQPGSTSYRYKLNPDYPNVLAALEEYKDELVNEMREVSKLRLRNTTKMSTKELAAWAVYKKTMGDDMPRFFEYASLQEIADKAGDFLESKIKQKT